MTFLLILSVILLSILMIVPLNMIKPLIKSKCDESCSVYRYYFDCSSDLVELIPSSVLWEIFSLFSWIARFVNILSPLLDVTRMSMGTVSFLCQLLR